MESKNYKNGSFVYDYTENDAEKEQFIVKLRAVCEKTAGEIYAGCFAKRLEDIKKVYYAGAKKVILLKDALAEEALIAQAKLKFGEESVLVYDTLAEAESEIEQLLSKERKASDVTLSFAELKTGADGLVPVVVQEAGTGEVLMLAYMNEEAYEATLRTGKMTYYSRSRKELWVKGETSGHFQYVRSLAVDCDNDTLLARVTQTGAACHTGNHSCFYRELIKEEGQTEDKTHILEKVYATVLDRKRHPKEGSYTNYLFDKGIDKILKKCGEEATEIVIAAKNPDKSEIKYEIADFLYHVTVLMAECGLDWKDVFTELANRD